MFLIKKKKHQIFGQEHYGLKQNLDFQGLCTLNDVASLHF